MIIFIKMSTDGISLLYSLVNWIKGSIEFIVSKRSSGLIWLLLKTVEIIQKDFPGFLNARFFISNTFFNTDLLLLDFVMDWASNVA